MNHLRLVAYGGAVVLKGALVAVTATLLNIDFWRAVIIAALSAGLTGGFLLLVAVIQDRRERRFEERLDRLERQGRDIAGATGANRRERDQ